MQVKDYLQALQDDSKIRVEKIGSVNWYWSFANEEKKAKESTLAKVREERDKAGAAVMDLRAKLDEASGLREEDEDMLLGEGGGNGRQMLMGRYAELGKEVEALRRELEGYSENDPVHVEMRRKETGRLREEVLECTDRILDMEGWMKEIMGHEREAWGGFKREMYGKEFDEEEEGLREL